MFHQLYDSTVKEVKMEEPENYYSNAVTPAAEASISPPKLKEKGKKKMVKQSRSDVNINSRN